MQVRIPSAIGRSVLPLFGAITLLCCRAPVKSEAAAGQQSRPTRPSLVDRVRELKKALPGAEIELDPTGSRVTFIQRLRSPVTSTSAEDIARSVLRLPAVGAALGLSRDLHELCAPVSRKDPQLESFAVVRMQQCVGGVKVLGAELVMNVQVSPTPAVETLTSSLVPDPPQQTTPKIAADEARKTAAAAVSAEGSKGRSPASSSASGGRAAPELVIFAPSRYQLEGPTRLCWLVRVNRMTVLVDAVNGSIVHRYSDVMH
jgi:hypothetical protein